MGKWRTGSLTAALGCIALGVLLVLIQLGALDYGALGYLWPALLIALGLEMLVRLTLRSGEGGRTNGWAVFLVIVIGLASAVPSVVGESSLGELFGKKHLSAVSGQVKVEDHIKAIRISIPSGKIKLTAADDGIVSYEGKLRSSGKDQSESDAELEKNWSAREEGDTLVLEQKAPSEWITNLFGFGPSPYLNVSLPSRLAATVSTSDGALDISGIEGGLDADTSNGRVVVQDVKGGVHASTSNGALELRRVEGGVDVDSSNGSITLESLSGQVTARSSNGRIVIDSGIDGDWDCDSSNGRIELTVPAQTNAVVTADTSNGSLKGDIGWDTEDDEDTSGSARLGSGQYTVKLSTTNGSVTGTLKH